ncbi:hypothetical protein [Fusobacterium mortiferum]|jgi:hypothetical protein|uniref:hypothetical protein n=1 Tax=Fusobacterium mortiferum TaxID=850 RepID=UPI000E495DF1|nr:hypothetical protein [Fusobacterium mortiferum]RHF69317.1 hypothetical protein DW670_01940 [Fusobacterium mortiferum]
MLKKMSLIYLLIFKLSLGYINIYPTFIYENLNNENAANTLVLTNTTDKTLRYRLYLEEDKYKNIKIEVYPKGITLKPFEKKEVKILLTINQKIKEEFSKVLVIKEVELPGKKKQILTMLRLKISGFVGELNPKLQSEELDNGRIKVKNIGNRTGIYNIYNNEKSFIDMIILKKNESIELEAKDKVLIFEEKFNGKNVIKRGIDNEN